MRIAVVGPTHPFKGGIAQHTTELARQLSRAGHSVSVVSWKSQYPARLYPGEMVVPDGRPEVPLSIPINRWLNWYDPSSWWRAGRRTRDVDMVIVAHSNPFQVAAYRSFLASASRGKATPTRVLVAHNVTPHESGPWQERAVDAFRGAIDAVIVHSEAERAEALVHFPGVDIRLVPLAPHGPAMAGSSERRDVSRTADAQEPIKLLAFGFIRPYKGLSLLLDAMESAPGVRLTIRGECWDDELDAQIRAKSVTPNLRGRVDYRSGYVPADDIDELFSTHDLAVLPYLEATGSQNTSLAQTYGLPVMVSDLPALTVEVAADVNGSIVPADDLAAWSAALAGLSRSDVERWRTQVAAVDVEGAWSTYIDAIIRPVDVVDVPTANVGVRQAHVIADPASRVAKAEAISQVVGQVTPLLGATVLDDGCGSGYIARELAAAVGTSGKVIGVDRVDERQSDEGYEFILLNGPTLPLDEGSIDIVISNHVLEHVGKQAEQIAYLREVHRVLKPGGWVYIAIPNKYRLVEAHYGVPLLSWLPQGAADRIVQQTHKGDWYDVDPLSRSGLTGVITAAGLTPTDITADIARRELGKLPGRLAMFSDVPALMLEPALQIAPTFVVLAQKL